MLLPRVETDRWGRGIIRNPLSASAIGYNIDLESALLSPPRAQRAKTLVFPIPLKEASLALCIGQ